MVFRMLKHCAWNADLRGCHRDFCDRLMACEELFATSARSLGREPYARSQDSSSLPRSPSDRDQCLRSIHCREKSAAPRQPLGRGCWRSHRPHEVKFAFIRYSCKVLSPPKRILIVQYSRLKHRPHRLRQHLSRGQRLPILSSAWLPLHASR